MENYDQQQIIDAFRDVMPQIRTAGNPEAALLKYASNKNLPPAVLEKLAQVYNTAKTLNVMKEAATQEERGKSFSIIDTPKLLGNYTSWTPPKVAANSMSDDALGWLEVSATEKSASASTPIEQRVPDFVGEVLGDNKLDLSVVPTTEVKSASAPSPRIMDIAHELDILNGVADEAEWHLRSLFNSQKSAAIRSRDYVSELFLDMKAHVDGDVAIPLRKLAAYLKSEGIEQTPIEDAVETRVLADDRHKAASWMNEVLATIDTRQGAAHYGIYLAKTAGVADDPDILDGIAGLQRHTDADDSFGAAAGGATEDGDRPSNAAPTLSDDEVADEEKAVNKKPPTPSEGAEPKKKDRILTRNQGPSKSTIDPRKLDVTPLVSGIADGRHRQMLTVDKATSDLNAVTVLQRLMLNDPILSEASPEDVVSQFNTIRTANPAIAQDPNLLTFALREAVQYGGLPLHQYDQLLETGNKAKRTDDDKSKDHKPGLNLNLLGI